MKTLVGAAASEPPPPPQTYWSFGPGTTASTNVSITTTVTFVSPPADEPRDPIRVQAHVGRPAREITAIEEETHDPAPQ